MIILGLRPGGADSINTGVLADSAGGMYGSDTIYYDSDPEQIEALEPTRPHRNVDLNVVAADKEGTH